MYLVVVFNGHYEKMVEVTTITMEIQSSAKL